MMNSDAVFFHMDAPAERLFCVLGDGILCLTGVQNESKIVLDKLMIISYNVANKH